MASKYFIYCSSCKFYPSGEDISVGITVEKHAINLANLHSSNTDHHCFVIPGSWMDTNTHIQVRDTSV